MDGGLKNFEYLRKVPPFGWKQKAGDAGALEGAREDKNAKGLLPVNESTTPRKLSMPPRNSPHTRSA
jgi:hypothetical protein